MMIERVVACKQHLADKEQCGFRSAKAYVDQVFAWRVCEKYFEKYKDLYVAFLYLEKGHIFIHIIILGPISMKEYWSYWWPF